MKRKETVSSQEMGTLLRKQQHPPPPDQWLPEGNFTENESQKISSVLCRKSVLPVCSTMLRTDIGTSSVYKDSSCCSSTSKVTKCTTSFVSRRLAGCKPIKNKSITRSRVNPRSPLQIRFPYKQRKISVNSNAKLDLHRGVFSVGQGHCISNSRQDIEPKDGNFQDLERSSFSTRLSPSLGNNGIMHRNSSQCASVHETNTTPCIKILESINCQFRSNNCLYTRSQISHEMVVTNSKYTEGQIFSTCNTIGDDNDRCVQNRLGWSHEQENSSGNMDRSPELRAYKLSGVGSSVFNNKTFSAISQEQEPVDSNRQLDSCPIYQQTRGYEIESIVHPNLGFMESSFTEQYDIESSSYSRVSECLSRPLESSTNTSNRMVPEQFDSSGNISHMARTSVGSICLSREQKSTSFLLLDRESSSLCTRCSNNILGGSVCVCVSSNMSYTEGLTTYASVSMPDNFNSASLAPQA